MLKFISHSSIFISLAALILTLGTSIQVEASESLYPLLILVFFATLLDYNAHRIIKVKFKNTITEKNRWANENLLLIWVFSIVSFLGTIISMFYIDRKVFLILVPIAFIAVLYSFPFEKTRVEKFSIRKITGLKNILIALAWTGITSLIPLKLVDFEKSNIEIAFFLTERFLFILAITIPFDIRDIDEDRMAGIKTIPMRLGIKKSLHLTNLLLVIFTVITMAHFQSSQNKNVMIALLISSVTTFIVVNHQKIKQNEYYYPVLLDTMLLVQGLLLFLFSYH